MTRKRETLLAGLASLALATSVFGADAKIYNGAACFSNRGSELTSRSARLSTDSDDDNGITSKFTCPLIRDNNQQTPFEIKLRINFLNGTFEADDDGWFQCTLRVLDRNGNTTASDNLILPARSAQTDSKFASKTISLMVPGANMAYSLRCNVPDMFSSEKSGIISYELTE